MQRWQRQGASTAPENSVHDPRPANTTYRDKFYRFGSTANLVCLTPTNIKPTCSFLSRILRPCVWLLRSERKNETSSAQPPPVMTIKHARCHEIANVTTVTTTNRSQPPSPTRKFSRGPRSATEPRKDGKNIHASNASSCWVPKRTQRNPVDCATCL